MGAIFPTLISGSANTIPQTPQSVNALFGVISNAASDAGQATAQGDIAAGDQAEAGAYGNAQAIADANSRLALVGGTIEQSMEQVKLGQTLGSQRAAVSAGGFANSGSALSLMQSSTRQGLLEQQITGVNAELQSGGFEEQGAASAAESAAASAAGNAATAMSANFTALSNASKTFATNTAAQMGLNVPGIANISGTSIPGVNDLTPGQQGPNNGLPYVGINGQLITPGVTNTPNNPAMPTVTSTGLHVPPPV